MTDSLKQPVWGHSVASMGTPRGIYEPGADIRYHRQTVGPRFRPLRRLALSAAVGVLFLGIRVPLHADDFVNGRLGEYLESLRVQTGIPGLAAAVVGRSDVLYERGFGYDDVDRNIVTRADSPMHLDGLTEMFSASLVMRCVEQGRISLDNTVGQFKPSSSDANLTLRQVLTHTGDGSYSYSPDRLGILQNGHSYVHERLVPGNAGKSSRSERHGRFGAGTRRDLPRAACRRRADVRVRTLHPHSRSSPHSLRRRWTEKSHAQLIQRDDADADKRIDRHCSRRREVRHRTEERHRDAEGNAGRGMEARPAVHTASAGSCSRTTARTSSGSLERARTARRR